MPIMATSLPSNMPDTVGTLKEPLYNAVLSQDIGRAKLKLKRLDKTKDILYDSSLATA